MTEDPLIREIAFRVSTLIKRHTAPLRRPGEDGHRYLMKDGWIFQVERYAPQFWGFGGPQFGQIKAIQVFRANDCVFNMIPPDDLGYDAEVAKRELLPYLRNTMVLDDMARVE